MTRCRQVFAAALVSACAYPMAAQLPPSIQTPITAARSAAAATDAQTRAAEQNAAARTKQASGAPQTGTAAKPRVNVGEGAAGSATIFREVFSYDARGRRDPFLSLMATGELRPVLADLALIRVIYDASSARRSIAMLTDGSTGQSYRTTVGATLGRMKVARIGPQDITFNIEEYGLSRQQTLVIDHTPKKDAGKSATRRPP